MRKLKRSMARANMQDAKIPSINKRIHASPKPENAKKVSFFSLHWREWIAGNPHTGKLRNKANSKRR